MTPSRPSEPWAINPISLAVLIWSLGWLMAAGLAAVAVYEHATASSVTGALITSCCAIIGIRFGRGGLIVRGDAAYDPPDGPPEGIARSVVGGIAVAVWSGIGIVWNFSVFATICRLAREGRGFTIALLLLWTLVGLIPLIVTVLSCQTLIRVIFRCGPGQRPERPADGLDHATPSAADSVDEPFAHVDAGGVHANAPSRRNT